jgi:hypothetical protein
MKKQRSRRRSAPSRGRRTSIAGSGLAEALAPAYADLLKDARRLVGCEDPLQVEFMASALVAVARSAEGLGAVLDLDVETGFLDGLIRFARAQSSEASLALLLGLGAVGPQALDGAVRSAAREIGTRFAYPRWADAIGRPAFERGWTGHDVFGEQTWLAIQFRHPGRDPHLMHVLVDRSLGGAIKDVAFTAVMEKLEELCPELEFEPAEGAVLAARLAAAVHATEEGGPLLRDAIDQDVHDNMALVAARLRRLPPPTPTSVADGSEPDLEALIDEYLESPHALGLDEEDFLVASVLQHRVETCGDPHLWSPSAVAETMLSWFPRQVSCPLQSARQLPAIMAALLRHVAMKRGLGRDSLDQLLKTVAAAEAEFVESVSDRRHYGPAKSIVMAMLDEGIDIGDRRAVDAWIAAFNRRPRAQRDLVLGHLLDASSLTAGTVASRTG